MFLLVVFYTVIGVVEQALLLPSLPTPNKHLYSGNELSIAPRQFFLSKGCAMCFMGFSTLVFKSCSGSMAELITSIQHSEPGPNERYLIDSKSYSRFVPFQSHPKLNFYLLPPVHGSSREKTQKKQFELLPCLWGCFSVPYLRVVQLNIWLVLGGFSLNCCASLCHATRSMFHMSSTQIHYLLFVPVVLFWIGHWIVF